MKLYDTLRRAIVEFEPRTPGEISIYACGPTVYDHPHLGHARQAMTYDIARRYFEWNGYRVHHVANVTDIDDNIINRAMREGLTETEVAERWEAEYFAVMAELAILPAHDRPHATDWVDEMIEFIELLIGNESAYVTDSGVYLRVRSVPDYGALVGRTHDELTEGAGQRVEVDPDKEDPLDFALWKSAKPGEPTWDSPWGPGRPGWHIECAAMSLGILDDGFDIHGGGTDLIFPHHTNERAESLAAGRSFANFWMHNAMLNIDGEKMSKSLNNFTTIRDVLEENPLNSRAIRLLLLQTHYRKTLELNADTMAQAREGLKRIDAMARKAVTSGVSLTDPVRVAEQVSRFRDAMDHDLGTPEAMAVVFETVRRANAALDGGEEAADAAALALTAIELANALGLQVGAESATDSDDDASIQALVDARSEAKAGKDFAEADRIRDDLVSQGIVVEDTPTGPTWYRQ